MTPARLEEVDEALGSEHPPDQRTLMGIAHELFAEVKRLREVLERIEEEGRTCGCSNMGPCGCGDRVERIAREALEETP